MLAFEKGTQSSIFSLVIKKKQTIIANLIPNTSETTDSIANRNVEGLFESIVHSKVTDNVLFYISGYIIRNLIKNIECQDCTTSMVQLEASTDYQYYAAPDATILNCNNRGCLIQESYGSYKVVAAAEKVCKLNVISTNQKCSNIRHLVQKTSSDVVSSSNWSAYFLATDHCFQVSVGFKDDRVTQIVKKVSHKNLKMRFHTYGKL